MPIQLNWQQLDPPILHYTMIAPWTWEEFFEAVAETRQIIDQHGFTSMDMIVEWGRTPRFPPSMLSHLSNLFQRGQTRSRHIHMRVVTVATPSLVRTIVDTLLKIHPRMAQRIIFAATVEEALVLLEQARAAEEPPVMESEAV